MKLMISRESKVESREPERLAIRDCFGPRPSILDPRPFRRAFTLLEVMIAGGILFMCLFGILAVLANCLSNARALQSSSLDCGMLAAEASQSQRLIEASDSGDFGDLYPGYRWSSETNIAEVSGMILSNGMFSVDFVLYPPSGKSGESHMRILLFRPDSPRR